MTKMKMNRQHFQYITYVFFGLHSFQKTRMTQQRRYFGIQRDPSESAEDLRVGLLDIEEYSENEGSIPVEFLASTVFCLIGKEIIR